MPVRLVSQEELPGPLKGYRLIERLGRGGFGEVWKVEAPGGLHKAAKFVFGDLEAMDEESRPAEQELKALRRVREIRHPYILSLERYDTIDGQLIIIMELADRNLWDRYRITRTEGLPGIPREELLGYMAETAEALDLMNGPAYQIQHLDVKPQNLFLVHNHVKVGDFGLAKLLEGIRATVTGGVTPVYAAPETFEGWVSRFSDQYSLAIVFQELLTGVRPFNGSNTRQLLMQHINAAPDLSSLPAADRSIIARGLAKKPDERWPTCSEMVRALKLSGLLPAPPSTVSIATVPVPVQGMQALADNRASAPGPRDSTSVQTQPVGYPPNDESAQATRVALGGSGRLGPDPTNIIRTQTPQPGSLPPLVKPASSHGIGTTPMPLSGLGARLVTPSAAAAGGGGNPAHTLTRPEIFQTGRMGSLGIAPPEQTGDGTLFPALVVAVGQTGKRAVEQLKRLIRERHGSSDRVPNVRVLYIDTDPEAIPTAAADDPAAIAPRETVLARLNRFGHYLQRESLPPVEQWMPSGTLYKLSRNPDSAGGVRAFGRLALFDNYRLIAQRVRQEIEGFLNDGQLTEADKNTRLGLRSNRPRAYVVAGLGGGTGSGMFLDLAFLLRHELRQVGYFRPEIVGMFFVPPADKAATRNAALGNACAALTELHHFQAKRTRYQTTFDKSEAAVVDPEPPFARVAVLPLPKKLAPQEQATVANQAAQSLFQEMLTPAGRAVDESRAAHQKVFPTSDPVCQTFGLYRLSWPRPEMLSAATRRFAQRQIQRWTAKEAAHLREPIVTWLAQQWVERKLDFQSLVDTLYTSVHDALREDPDKVFDAFVDPLRSRTPSSGRIDAAGACQVFDQLLKVVGKPDCENEQQPGSLAVTLTETFERLMKESEGHLAVMAATFLEVPQFRLPGSEEAVRQIAERLKTQIDALAPVRADLEKEVRTIFGRLFQGIGALGTTTSLGAISGRRASVTAEVLDLMRSYPRKRLQLNVLDLAFSIYRRLLENAPEYLREINYCRSSLAEMHAAFAKGAPKSPESLGSKLILPDGCKDLDSAADQFLADLAPEDLLAFEQSLQKDIAKKFKGLGNVCLKSKQKGEAFQELLLAKSWAFLDEKLERADPATMFFRYRTADGNAEPQIGEAFDEAAPDIVPPNKFGEKPQEINILAVPPTEAGNRFRELAAQVLPGVDLAAAPLLDDICFYREYPQMELADLPQLGEFGREACQQMASADHPPYTRTDVPWQPPGT